MGGRTDVGSHGPQAFLEPPASLQGRLLPRGLPGNIFLVNVYIFGDSWFICGQSVPGERHTGHSRLADRGGLTPRERLRGSSLPWGPGPSFPGSAVFGGKSSGCRLAQAPQLSSSRDLELAGLGGSWHLGVGPV